MKYILLGTALLFTVHRAEAQLQRQMIGFFKTQNIDSIVSHSALPFHLEDATAGSTVNDSATLRKRLTRDFKQHYFDSWLRGKISVSKTQSRMDYKGFDGQDPTESSIIFEFKQMKNGEYKLTGVFMAG